MSGEGTEGVLRSVLHCWALRGERTTLKIVTPVGRFRLGSTNATCNDARVNHDYHANRQKTVI